MLSLDCALVRREPRRFTTKIVDWRANRHRQSSSGLNRACRVEAEDLRIIREGLRAGAASLHAWDPDLGVPNARCGTGSTRSSAIPSSAVLDA